MCSKVSFAIKETDNMIAHSRVFNQCTSAFSGVYGVCVCVCVCVEIGHREKHTKKFEGVLDGLKPRPRSVTPSLCTLPRHFATKIKFGLCGHTDRKRSGRQLEIYSNHKNEGRLAQRWWVSQLLVLEYVHIVQI